MLCVSFEVMGFWDGIGGKLYSRRLTPCGRGLMAPPGLTALGAKGSVRDRLTPPGRVEGSRPRELYSIAALARYGALEGASINAAFGGENHICCERLMKGLLCGSL